MLIALPACYSEAYRQHDNQPPAGPFATPAAAADTLQSLGAREIDPACLTAWRIADDPGAKPHNDFRLRKGLDRLENLARSRKFYAVAAITRQPSPCVARRVL